MDLNQMTALFQHIENSICCIRVLRKVKLIYSYLTLEGKAKYWHCPLKSNRDAAANNNLCLHAHRNDILLLHIQRTPHMLRTTGILTSTPIPFPQRPTQGSLDSLIICFYGYAV